MKILDFSSRLGKALLAEVKPDSEYSESATYINKGTITTTPPIDFDDESDKLIDIEKPLIEQSNLYKILQKATGTPLTDLVLRGGPIRFAPIIEGYTLQGKLPKDVSFRLGISSNGHTVTVLEAIVGHIGPVNHSGLFEEARASNENTTFDFDADDNCRYYDDRRIEWRYGIQNSELSSAQKQLTALCKPDMEKIWIELSRIRNLAAPQNSQLPTVELKLTSDNPTHDTPIVGPKGYNIIGKYTLEQDPEHSTYPNPNIDEVMQEFRKITARFTALDTLKIT